MDNNFETKVKDICNNIYNLTLDLKDSEQLVLNRHVGDADNLVAKLISEEGKALVQDLQQDTFEEYRQVEMIKDYCSRGFIYALAYDGVLPDSDNSTFVNALGAITTATKKLLIKKNHDYGSSYQKVADILGAIPAFSVRILDKCNRLDNLINSNKTVKVKDESLSDTIQDLLGYYVLFIISLENK